MPLLGAESINRLKGVLTLPATDRNVGDTGLVAVVGVESGEASLRVSSFPGELVEATAVATATAAEPSTDAAASASASATGMASGRGNATSY